MTKTTEALKLAEEACKTGIDVCKIVALFAAKSGNDDMATQFLEESKFDKALAAIREAMAEQEKQEPVFTMVYPRCKVDRATTQCPNRGGIGDCPMTAQAQNTAPVSAKREWVELTDDEELELAKRSVGKSRHWLVAEVIAAFKEKNK